MRSLGRSAPLLVLVALLAGTACRSTPDPLEPYWGEEHPNGRGLTADELAARLQEFTFQFSGALQQTCAQMCAMDDDIGLRRRSILWRSRMVPEVRRAANHENPVEAYIDTWTLCVQQRLFFEEEQGPELFEEHSAAALKVSEALEQDIERVGASFMTQENLARARVDVLAFAEANPFKEGWSRQGNLPSTSGDPEFEWIIGNPLSGLNPFRGLSTGAQAVMEFTKVADDFKNMVGHMPEELSWKVELLMTDIEERGRTRELAESVVKVSEASLSLADTADRLPEEMRTVISHTFEELEGQHVPMQATLAESRATMTELSGAIENANQLVASLDQTLERVVRAGEAWEAVGVAFLGDEDEDAEEPAAPPNPDKPSFFEEVDVAAQSLLATAAEIRGLLADVDAVSTGEGKDELAAAATTASRSTIDHATWRAIQLTGVVLLAGIAYQFAKRRIGTS